MSVNMFFLCIFETIGEENTYKFYTKSTYAELFVNKNDKIARFCALCASIYKSTSHLTFTYVGFVGWWTPKGVTTPLAIN